MCDVTRKMMGTALAAVLVFYLAFPGTSFTKPEKAEAIVPVVAAPVIFGTLCAAGGVYAAGMTLTQYNSNLQSLYDGFAGGTNYWSSSWQQYVQDQGSFQNALNSCVTADGTISLQTMNDAGFFDSLHSYSAYIVEHGDAVVGSSSKIETGQMTINGIGFATISSAPAEFAYASGSWGMDSWESVVAMYSLVHSDGKKEVNFATEYQGIGQRGAGYYLQVNRWIELRFDASGNYLDTYTNHNAPWFNPSVYSEGNYTVYSYINAAHDWSSLGDSVQQNAGADGKIASVEQSALDGDYSTSNATVAPFDPTDEILQQGFSSVDVLNGKVDDIADATGDIATDVGSILSAITSTVGSKLNQIKNGVEGLPSAVGAAVASGAATVVNGLSGVLNDIKTGVNGLETVIGTAVSSGASTVVNGLSGTLNDIKTGIGGLESAIGTAVASGASTVVNGLSGVLNGINTTVGTISGTLDDIWGGVQGWWTDLLAWLGATPLAQLIANIIAAIQAGVLSLEGAITAVQAWISAAVADIVGAIEGVQFPTFPEIQLPTWFELEQPTGGNDGGTSNVNRFQSLLNDKAPFAYMFAFSNAIQNADNGNTNNPRFKISHEFSIMGRNLAVTVDAEPYLLYDLGGTNMAYLLRMCFTMTLCMGLLYSAYRIGVRAFKS